MTSTTVEGSIKVDAGTQVTQSDGEYRSVSVEAIVCLLCMSRHPFLGIVWSFPNPHIFTCDPHPDFRTQPNSIVACDITYQ